jgi:hypothetical protein
MQKERLSRMVFRGVDITVLARNRYVTPLLHARARLRPLDSTRSGLYLDLPRDAGTRYIRDPILHAHNVSKIPRLNCSRSFLTVFM